MLSSKAQCDYTAWQNITLNTSGTVVSGYTSVYLLTDYQGTILEINSSASFTGKAAGMYIAYQVSYKTSSGISGMSIGAKIGDVYSPCFSLSNPLALRVCNSLSTCDYTPISATSFSASGGAGSGYSNTYILTNYAGTILSISNTLSFGTLDTGNYIVYNLNYKSNGAVNGLAIGSPINQVSGTCFDLSSPLAFSVCNSNTLSGNVYQDTNALTDLLVNGTVTNAGGLYVILTDASGNVLSSMPVNADGTFSFSNIPDGSYKLLLNNASLPAGNVFTTAQTVAGWVSTGESILANAASDGTVDGAVSITLNGSSNTSLKFGLDQLYLSVSNASVTEGNNLVFDITLNYPSSTPVLFTPSLASVTATVGTDTGTPIEYSTDGGATWTTWTSGSITIPAGITSLKFRVPSVDDNIAEQAETFMLTATVTSGNTTNTTATGTGTINDNDVTTLSVSNVSATEGSNLVFDITLSKPSSTPVLFTPSLASVTATVGTDTGTPIEYSTDGGATWTTWTSGSITIPAGVTSVQFRVPTTDDNIAEQNETFTLTATVTSGNTTNTTATGTGTINDNDVTTLSVSNASVTEGGNLVFDITLSKSSSTPVVFTPSLASVTATVGTDTGTPIEYSTDGGNTWTTWTSGSITIPAGVTSVKFRVPTTDDNISEANETFTLTTTVTSGNTTNATASGTGTIIDNDIFANDDTGVFVDAVNGGTAVTNILANDQIYGTAPALTDVLITVVTPATNNGVLLNTATGEVTVTPGTPAGIYSIVYQICKTAGAPACDQATVTVTISAVSDLGIVKTLLSSSVEPGGSIAYQLVITNYGQNDASGVVVTDNLPAGLTSPFFSINGGSTWAPWTGSYSAGTLMVGQSLTMLINAQVNASQCAPFVNTATVASSSVDYNTTNNSSSVTATPVSPASLLLTSAVSTTNQQVCIYTGIQTITYSFGGADGVIQVSGLPPGVSYTIENGIVTITGSPQVGGDFPYSVTYTANCAVITETGIIKIPNGTAGVWTGAYDNDWFNCANWANGIVPDQNTAVFIPKNSLITPVIDTNSIYAANFNKTATAKSLQANDLLAFTPGALLEVYGNVTIGSAGTINMTQGGLLELTGNWTDNAGAGGLIEGSGTIAFTGSQPQYINSAETFNNLIISQVVGAANGVYILADIRVDDTLTLENGIVYTMSATNPGYGLLTLGTDAAPVAGNPGLESFVSGKIAKEFDGPTAIPYLMPIGKDLATDLYKPVYIWPSTTDYIVSGSLSTFTAEYMPQTTAVDLLLGGVMGIATNEYWQIDRDYTGTPIDAKIALFFQGSAGNTWSDATGSQSPCYDCGVAVVASNTGGYWSFTRLDDFYAGNDFPQIRAFADQGWIFSEQLSVFGKFTFGFGMPVVLDVKLLSFAGKLNAGDGLLSWKVSGIKDLKSFVLEHSTNGQNFTPLASIAPTVSDAYAYRHPKLAPGNHYYRLLVNDKSGKAYYSNIVLLSPLPQAPVSKVIKLVSTVITNKVIPVVFSVKSQTVHAAIYDAAGHLVEEHKGILEAGNNEWLINTHLPASGMYFIVVETQDGAKETLRFFRQ